MAIKDIMDGGDYSFLGNVDSNGTSVNKQSVKEKFPLEALITPLAADWAPEKRSKKVQVLKELFVFVELNVQLDILIKVHLEKLDKEESFKITWAVTPWFLL